jgi:23S rRNA (uracil1939-C5)-methyltransferase
MKKKTEELLELEIEAIGFEGISIARKNEQVYFVRGGLPGDTVVAKLKKRNKKYTEATIKEIIKPSKHRIDAFCEYFGACGGCAWQCLEYQEQIQWKKQHTIDAHSRLGNFSDDYLSKVVYHDTIPAKQTLEYRNKMDFSFSNSRWLTTKEIDSDEKFNNNFALGLHIPGRFDKVIDVKNCKIQKNEWNQILDFIRQKSISLEVAAHNSYNQTGFLKGLCLRHSQYKSETMVNLFTTSIQNENEKEFINWYRFELAKNFPNISSVVHTVNNQNSVNIGEIQFVEGNNFITEAILGIEYQVSPFSFFQTNSTQLDTFIKLILDSANLKSADIVWDLYCGTGSITLPAAKLCSEIYGIELSESSVNDAKKNAKNNNISNSFFYAADLHSAKIPELLTTLPKPNVIIIDPPRSGTNSNLIEHILKIAPKKLVYVSCNPATQARDLTELSKKYQLQEVFTVDMFPHTYHIEVVAVLLRED